jgi:alpha-beta hydrolase superfamily lysophospholipase
MMRTETSRFDGRGGRLFWRAWLPDGEAHGVVTLVHGVGEHTGRYEHVGQRLAGSGFAVYGEDHIGHGQSDGHRANIESMDAAADNVAAMMALAAERHPDVPRFVLGHSMGALITLHLATRAPLAVAGIVVSAPPLVIDAGGPVLRLVAPLLSRYTPDLGALAVDSPAVSRDPEVVRAYDADPLVHHGKLPARTAVEILNTARTVAHRLDRLTVPTLVLQGTSDRLANPAGATLIEQSAAAADLTVIRYPGLFHEVFNEPEQDTVLTDVVTWLEGHRHAQ